VKKHQQSFFSKKFATVLLMIVCFSFILSFPSSVNAQEVFVINQYNVIVQSNLNNSFDFTETITMDFSSKSHGILRAIPKEGGSLRYTVSNIKVKGDSFTIEQDALNVIIRIGDAANYVSGSKTYTISYTLTFNKDNDPTQDLVNLDLIGNMWNTQIKSATIDFYFPTKSSKPDKYQVFTGVYGSRDETGARVTQESDHLRIQNLKELSNLEGISLYAKFPDNTFNQAVDLPEPYHLSDYNAAISVKKDRVVHYKETFNLKINDQSQLVYYRLPLLTQDQKALVIHNIRLNGEKLAITDTQGVFPILLSQEGKNTLEYNIYYEADDNPSADTLSLMLFSNYREVALSDPGITIESAFKAPVSYKTIVAITKAEGTGEKLQNTQGETVNIEIKAPLEAGEGIFIDLEYPEGSFGFVLSIFTIVSMVIGILLLILSIYWYQKHGKDAIVSPVVEFYPPEGLSSGAIGYIGNRLVNPIDITSMLIYWASHNHLHFLATGKNDFTLSFQSDLDELHPQWEQNAFAKLKELILNADNSLTKEELQTNFYKVAEKIRPAIPLYFKNERALDDKVSTRMSGLLSFISAFWMGIFTGIIAYTGLESGVPSLIAGVTAFILSLIYFGLIRALSNGWYKRAKIGNYSLVFVYILFGLVLMIVAIILSLSVSTTVQFPAILFTLLAVIISQVIAVFTIKRSVYGQQMLERVVGFKEFLKTAEKERLEALLNENPEYYYQILPYALVLNVSDIWESKFRGLQMVEPSWYQGGYPGYVFTYAALNSFAHSASTTLSHYTAPPSASGTGGFSGGGGGGFSGGGGGGGGGSSW